MCVTRMAEPKFQIGDPVSNVKVDERFPTNPLFEYFVGKWKYLMWEKHDSTFEISNFR